jgi:hypothetical protein
MLPLDGVGSQWLAGEVFGPDRIKVGLPQAIIGFLANKALMIDVDGVLVDGRPEDGRHWQTSIGEDLGFSSAALHEHFFVPYWEDIVVGRTGLMEHLPTALLNIAPQVRRFFPIGSRGTRVSSPLCCRNSRWFAPRESLCIWRPIKNTCEPTI